MCLNVKQEYKIKNVKRHRFTVELSLYTNLVIEKEITSPIPMGYGLALRLRRRRPSV